jgi:hypothetical protein
MSSPPLILLLVDVRDMAEFFEFDRNAMRPLPVVAHVPDEYVRQGLSPSLFGGLAIVSGEHVVVNLEARPRMAAMRSAAGCWFALARSKIPKSGQASVRSS